MARITITTAQGIVMEQLDTQGMDFTKAMPRLWLIEELLPAIKKADDYDKREQEQG